MSVHQDNSQLIYFHNAGISPSDNTTWLTTSGILVNLNEYMSYWLFTGGTISNLMIGCTGNLGADNINVQVYIDGTGTSLSCSMTDTQTSASDNDHIITLGPTPSRLSILCTNKNLSFPKNLNMIPMFGHVLYTPN